MLQKSSVSGDEALAKEFTKQATSKAADAWRGIFNIHAAGLGDRKVDHRETGASSQRNVRHVT